MDGKEVCKKLSSDIEPDVNDIVRMKCQELRLKVVETILHGFELMKYNSKAELRDIMIKLIREIKMSDIAGHEYVQNLLFDLDGDRTTVGQFPILTHLKRKKLF